LIKDNNWMAKYTFLKAFPGYRLEDLRNISSKDVARLLIIERKIKIKNGEVKPTIDEYKKEREHFKKLRG